MVFTALFRVGYYGVIDLLNKLAMLGKAADVSLDPMIVIDGYNRILYCNEATGTLFGYTRDELISSSLLALLPADAHEPHCRGLARFVKNKGTARSTVGYVEVKGVHRQGHLLPFSLSMTYGELDGLPFISGVLRDMREIKASEDLLAQKVVELQELTNKLQFLSERDHLTGAYNRHHLSHFVEAHYAAEHTRSEDISVMICDIDHFKLYNDRFGHVSGDICLKTVTNTIRDTIGKRGTTYRYGGEEFLIGLTSVDAHRGEQIGEEIRRSVIKAQLPHPSSKSSEWVSISVGGATGKPADTAWASLLIEADKALYRAKITRNAVHWASPLSSAQSDAFLDLTG